MFAASTTSLHILTTKKRHCFALVAARAKKFTVGFLRFVRSGGRPKEGQMQVLGFLVAAAVVAGAVAAVAVLTRGRQIIPPPSGGNNNNSGNGGNPGDQASGGYGSGNSGGNAGSSPPSSTPSGPSQAEINEQNRINRERAQAEADRREAQDQALRDQIEEDRRMQRNRDIVAQQQQQQQQPTTSFDNWLEQAQNVRSIRPGSTINNFDPYQVATTEENAFNSAVEQSLAADKKEAEKARLEQAGFTIQGENVRDANGAFVGKLSDSLGKLMAGGTGYSDYDDYMKKFGDDYESNAAYSNYEDHLESNPTAQPTTVPAKKVAATGIASVGTDYGYETNQERLDKYKLDPEGYEANDTSKEARLWRARNGGMSETDNPRLDKDGNPVAAKDAKYLDAADCLMVEGRAALVLSFKLSSSP
jgi:hypothetical protein